MHVLDNAETVCTIDPSNILGLAAQFPEHIKDAITCGNKVDISKEYGTQVQNIVFSGMGGSAIGADLIRCLFLNDIQIPIIVNRDYRLPHFVNQNTLLIVSSYSGNTEETVSSLADGIKRGAKIITITTGGVIGKAAKDNAIPMVTIPEGIPPRHALAYLVFPVLVIFEKLFSAVRVFHLFDEVIHVLSDLRDNDIGHSQAFSTNKAKQIAELIYKRFPIIYTHNEYFAPVALRWRGQLEENAKMMCSHHVIPEMNHNEIMGWQKGNTSLDTCIVVMLKDAQSNPRVNQRIDITTRVIRDKGFDVIDVLSQGTSVLSRIMSLLYIADFVSLYCAILHRINPVTIDAIDYLKNELRKST